MVDQHLAVEIVRGDHVEVEDSCPSSAVAAAAAGCHGEHGADGGRLAPGAAAAVQDCPPWLVVAAAAGCHGERVEHEGRVSSGADAAAESDGCGGWHGGCPSSGLATPAVAAVHVACQLSHAEDILWGGPGPPGRDICG
jgi:hypothetical protein